jgi:hypothetical protein
MLALARTSFVPATCLLACSLARAQEPFVISRDSAQNLANAASYDASVSVDGRFFAFDSAATNLVSGDVNAAKDVFWRDRQFAITRCVSVSSSGTAANNISFLPSISASGRYVVFYSLASNLTANDTNNTIEVFEHDTQTLTPTLISVAPSGFSGNFGSFDPDVSADGSYVVFGTEANNLVTGDTNNKWDILLRDAVANTTVRVTQGIAGQQPNNSSYRPRISDDGAFVCFMSDASNLVVGDVNNVRDVFLYECATGTITSPTMDPSLLIGNGPSENPDLNANGDFVVYTSLASNFVAGDTNGAGDIFRWRRSNNAIIRASVSSGNVQAGSTCFLPTISSNGARVAFTSAASNLVPADTNAVVDAFVRDIPNATTTRVSVDSAGQQVSGASGSPQISADGATVVFRCASSLVTTDTNGAADIYAWGD